MGKKGTKHGEREIYPIKGGTRWAYKWPVLDAKGKKKFSSRSFKTAEEAAAFKKEKDKELREQGERNTWSETDRRDAAEARRILSVYSDVSLLEAAKFYCQHHPLDKSVTIGEAVEAYLLYRKPDSLCKDEELKSVPIKSFKRFADKTYSDRIKPTFKLLKEAFGDRAVSSVMRAEIEDYFLGRGLVAETFNNKISDVKVFFDWCIRVKKCAELNPAASIDSLAGEFAIPVIYTVNEVLKILEAAVRHDPQLVPFLVLAAFAGIRTCEIKRMKVTDIDFENQIINIRPQVAKSKGADGAMPRIIEGLPGALWKWLQAAGGDSVKIDTKNLQKRRLEVFKQAEVEFKANAFRHSYATYGYAFFQSDDIVRKHTGHRIPDTFFKHYATTVRKSDGDAYFAILPTLSRLPEKGTYKARYTPKIDWPEVDIVLADVKQLGFRGTARKYSEEQGVKISDNAVMKHLRRNGIEPPRRGTVPKA